MPRRPGPTFSSFSHANLSVSLRRHWRLSGRVALADAITTIGKLAPSANVIYVEGPHLDSELRHALISHVEWSGFGGSPTLRFWRIRAKAGVGRARPICPASASANRRSWLAFDQLEPLAEWTRNPLVLLISDRVSERSLRILAAPRGLS
jgi:hypothetical protein